MAQVVRVVFATRDHSSWNDVEKDSFLIYYNTPSLIYKIVKGFYAPHILEGRSTVTDATE